jgi:putative MATE family efflux protein
MERDMTKGAPARTMLYFSLPMVAGNLFQQMYNVADSMIVGNFVSADALGAIGVTSSVTFLLVALATGVSMGASVVIAQLYGAQKRDQMESAISTALRGILVLALILGVAGLLLHSALLRALSTPAENFADAETYLRIYLYGTLFLFLYNACNAVFHAIGDSRTPLLFLIFSSVLNVVLDLFAVITLQMGVAGAAWATVFSQALAAVLCTVILVRRLGTMGLEIRRGGFDRHCLWLLCRSAIPSTIQQSIVSVGTLLVQSVINSFGAVVLNGISAASKIDNIAMTPIANVSNAMSNYTAQNIGAGKPERVPAGLRAGILINLGIVLIIFVLLQLFPAQLIGAFMDTDLTDPQVIAVGVTYLRFFACINLLFALMTVLNGVLKGAGDLRWFLFITVLNLGVRVIAAFLLAAPLGWSTIYWSQLIGWLSGLVVVVPRYCSGKWKEKSLISG